MATVSEGRFTRGRVSRGRGLRKTTGCLTCRRRHVKCDEAKPTCANCTKSKQACSYSLPRERRDHTRSVSKRGTTSSTVPRSTSEAVIDDSDDNQEVENAIDTSQAAQGTGWQACHAEPGYIDVNTQSPEAETSALNVARMTFAGPEPGQQRPPGADGLPPMSGTLPAYTTVSTNSNVETATARWLGLLLGDAVLDSGVLPGLDCEDNGIDVFGNSVVPTTSPDSSHTHIPDRSDTGLSPSSNPSLQERLMNLGGEEVLEKQAWHSNESLELLAEEKPLFQSFVRHISLWMDFFDPKKPFGTFVPRLAMHNVGLMNAVLCLAARFLSLQSSTSDQLSIPNRASQNDAIQYYYKTLHYIQKAMQYDTYKTSLELLSTSLIVSTYEMLDGSSENWERHLKGVFWIQRSQTIHGDSRGLRQGVWWAWLCQDVWAAFREKRNPFTFWRPIRALDELDPHELAARSVYLFAQAVGLNSEDQREEDKNDLTARRHKADNLLNSLKDWRGHLTVEFEPLPIISTVPEETFPPVWIHPPSFGVAIQLYYCSIILVMLGRPMAGGINDYLEQRRTLSRCVKMICGIAKAQDDYESSVMSSQCLFIAGMSIEDAEQRKQVIRMLHERHSRCGWPLQSLANDLLANWKAADEACG